MYSLNCRGKLLPIDKAVVMGILNLTPDSFYAGSRVHGMDQFLKQSEQMLKEGAAILDIGGQSTRPGSTRISEEEEFARVIGPIEQCHRQFPDAIISIDTYYSKLASAAVHAGASIVNDISGGEMDLKMLDTVAELKVPYICSHMKGRPDSMQDAPDYKDVVVEVLDFFIAKINACRTKGISDLVLDPGFGFGKTIRHNFQLLKGLSAFRILDLPIMAGLSRKSTVYKTIGVSAEEALNGSTVLHTIALMNGAQILRVHDVKAAVEAVKLFAAYNQA